MGIGWMERVGIWYGLREEDGCWWKVWALDGKGIERVEKMCVYGEGYTRLDLGVYCKVLFEI